MRSLLQPTALLTLLLTALPAGAAAQQDDDAFLRVSVPEAGEDRIHRLRTQVRHTTVIVLPADENILDFVVGDSEYWHLAGAANVAFLKPLRPDAATNIALVCESGRIYSFLVAEHSEGPPHLVVRVESGAEETGLSGGGTGRPAFVARSEVAAYQQMAAEAAEAASGSGGPTACRDTRSRSMSVKRRGGADSSPDESTTACSHARGAVTSTRQSIKRSRSWGPRRSMTSHASTTS